MVHLHRFIKLENLTKHVGGAKFGLKLYQMPMVVLIKFIMLQFIVCFAKRSGKKLFVGDTGAGYAGKMLSMAAKKFGLKCKIFMGAKDMKDNNQM